MSNYTSWVGRQHRCEEWSKSLGSSPLPLSLSQEEQAQFHERGGGPWLRAVQLSFSTKSAHGPSAKKKKKTRAVSAPQQLFGLALSFRQFYPRVPSPSTTTRRVGGPKNLKCPQRRPSKKQCQQNKAIKPKAARLKKKNEKKKFTTAKDPNVPLRTNLRHQRKPSKRPRRHHHTRAWQKQR